MRPYNNYCEYFYRLPCNCLRSLFRFDMKVREIDVAGKAEHTVKVVLDRLKLVGVVDVADVGDVPPAGGGHGRHDLALDIESQDVSFSLGHG